MGMLDRLLGQARTATVPARTGRGRSAGPVRGAATGRAARTAARTARTATARTGRGTTARTGRPVRGRAAAPAPAAGGLVGMVARRLLGGRRTTI